MIRKLNDPEWYKRMVRLNIDRMSLLTLIGTLELILRHPDLPYSIKESSARIGKCFATCLLDNGLIIPDEVARSWEKAFSVPCTVDPDLILPELTDQEGRPWK